MLFKRKNLNLCNVFSADEYGREIRRFNLGSAEERYPRNSEEKQISPGVLRALP